MKHGSTIVLKSVIVLMGIAVLAVSLLTFSVFIRGQVGAYTPILIGVYVSLVPFFYALLQAFKILGYIDHNKAFSQPSVDALRAIKFSALAVGLLYSVGLPFIYMIADKDDSPGTIVMAMIVAFGAYVSSAFVAVAQQLFQNGVDIKSENDLTV